MKLFQKQRWLLTSIFVAWAASLCNTVVARQENLPQDPEFPIPNQTAVDDPRLPRFLYLGDSISLNYGKAILDFAEGKLNVHRPLENCGSSERGRQRVSTWLGDYQQPGRQWDIISFNFGHWDVTSSKQVYQENLHEIIKRLQKTRAQLVWVTTCPVPEGFEPLGTPATGEIAPGRKSNVMKTLLNPWAAEVIEEYPGITICDQWQFVHENRAGLYQDWWKGNDVHFSAGPAYAIGRLLAEHVLELTGQHRGPGWKRPTGDVKPQISLRGNAAWSPSPYHEPKWGEFYSNAETASHLPDRWKDARRLPNGFPKDFSISLSPTIPDYQGWNYDLAEVANHLQLKSIKQDIQNGHRLAWYQLPENDRTRVGPGLTGDELKSDLESGKFPKDISYDEFVDGFFHQNVSTLYDLYQVTRDRFYSDEIVKYADAVEWILDHRSVQLLDRENDHVSKAKQASIFWAHISAARLLAEQVRVDRGGPGDARAAMAKRFLERTNKYLKPLFVDADQDTDPGTNEKTSIGADILGPNTRWLVQERKTPRFAAESIEYSPWNQTLDLLSVLTAAVRTMEELQVIENSSSNQNLIDSYRRTIAGGIALLQRENDCVVVGGVPYFFHAHTALQDRTVETRLGHPMFAGESTDFVAGNVQQLAYIWDAGDTFGCPTALVAGYTNAMIDFLEHPTGEKDGQLYPSANLDSPWFIAATGRLGGTASRLGAEFYVTAPLAPEIVRAQQFWSLRKGRNEEIQFLRAATLYRQWLRRLQRAGN